MSKIRLLFLTSFLILISCHTDYDENIPIEELNAVKSSFNLTSSSYMLTALVDEGWCATASSTNDIPGGRKYSIYASSGLETFSDDLQVYVYVVHTKKGEKRIVEATILQLRANQTKTNNVFVFEDAIEEYGKVEVKIAAIMKGGTDLTDQFELRDTTPTINNCYFKPISSTNCFAVDGNSSPSEFESAGDSDHDGICDNKDKDDDNDLIPDIVDDDDDGDGIPDDEEGDDDTDSDNDTNTGDDNDSPVDDGKGTGLEGSS